LKFTVLFLIIACAFLHAQDGFPGMTGNTNDINFIPPQTKQNNDFTFARLIYNGRIEGYNKNWYTDYPSGDVTAVEIIKQLTNIDVAKEGRAIPINHPDLFNYPFVFSLEGGQMVLSESEAKKMREYIDRGGFWMIDDFWGTFEWGCFEKEMAKVFPERTVYDIPVNHPIFHTIFDINNLMQVPNIGYAYCTECPTWELDGYEPKVRGIFDDDGDLVVVMFFNTDTMDALEWANDPKYPHHFSAYAYKIFINTIVYAMSH